MLLYHIVGFTVGFILDLLVGDPYFLPHPVRLMGKLIAGMEGILLKEKADALLTKKDKKIRGVLLVLLVLTGTGITTAVVLYLSYSLHAVAGMLVESIMTYQILATKCLKQESMKVFRFLEGKDIEGARHAVSMLVGRDTDVLNESGITKAAVETVAENCSDGVIAPMLYLAIGGPVLGFLYKAVNTMDSMVGYKNEKYRYFGWAAAKLDDMANFLPARISALLMIAAAFLPGREFDGKGAISIFKRDRFNHASPNSAQTESVCAGALSIRLAGDAVYFGKTVSKPFIGEAKRAVEQKDIVRAGRLLYRTAFLGEGICLILLLLIWRLC